jgi:serine protease
MAGIIGAGANNGIGIVGVSPKALIQPIRALSWRGGLLSDVAASITWASGGSVPGVPDNATPANVINLSFATFGMCTPALQTAIDGALSRGASVAAAAGNSNDDVRNYAPANCDGVISVGASDKNGKRAAYSNFGEGIDVSAPGGDINDDGTSGVYTLFNNGTTVPSTDGYTFSQ